MSKIDARGLDCPKPVILIKKALEGADEASILVDNQTARENVARFGENAGCSVTILENQEGIELFLKKVSEKKTSGEEEAVVLIKTSRFGEGDETLGALLMKSFLVSLLEGDKKVKALIFMNKGVELTTAEGDILEILKAHEAKGTAIYSCGTCLDYYRLKEKLLIGQVTNMYSAVEMLTDQAYKVITI